MLNVFYRHYLPLAKSQRHSARAEIVDLENSITLIEDILGSLSGDILVTDFGVWGTTDDRMAPLGYNPWLATECKNEIGQVQERDYVIIEGADFKMKAINPLEGLWF